MRRVRRSVAEQTVPWLRRIAVQTTGGESVARAGDGMKISESKLKDGSRRVEIPCSLRHGQVVVERRQDIDNTVRPYWS